MEQKSALQTTFICQKIFWNHRGCKKKKKGTNVSFMSVSKVLRKLSHAEVAWTIKLQCTICGRSGGTLACPQTPQKLVPLVLTCTSNTKAQTPSHRILDPPQTMQLISKLTLKDIAIVLHLFLLHFYFLFEEVYRVITGRGLMNLVSCNLQVDSTANKKIESLESELIAIKQELHTKEKVSKYSNDK